MRRKLANAQLPHFEQKDEEVEYWKEQYDQAQKGFEKLSIENQMLANALQEVYDLFGFVDFRSLNAVGKGFEIVSKTLQEYRKEEKK